ncbi:VOC family protein [Microbacterium sp. EYE_5]|uniref:VOC family protein n=1 Tax=unclassified Microbacterium TaxID=2609290 RepID=UPI0020032C1D|nr:MULTISPECIES: VOC family protein [unclassified Microbacterium]MCK6081314.1 VOC family protein [Microbacterium sp. EYE_382]MCK6086584.1 VOC family protein [Microbacterium sp. EYE_384]MCK6123918.1 VOC family protein [Microbacterium sp. EYE_80]MCK6126827.1 VOC family protein [Microbacterium sp. EYE_79]MCK6142269.1 VOC family protein [Microbacterium sp. EYE_39]
MKIQTVSVFVDDQQRALEFYTEKLGFAVAADVPMGEHRWLTVVDPTSPEGTQLSLEPKGHPAVSPFTDALLEDGIPFFVLGVDDVRAEYERLQGLGVEFTQPPMDHGPVTTAVLSDTVGNLLQIAAFAS